MSMMMNEYDVIGINQCLCLPKAELNTKNEPKRPPLCGRLGSFLVFNSVHKKKENAAYPVHAAPLHIIKIGRNFYWHVGFLFLKKGVF